MNFTYTHFRLFIHLLVAFVFLSELLESRLPDYIYQFLQKNKDIIFGCYYLYLSYEVYSEIKVKD